MRYYKKVLWSNSCVTSGGKSPYNQYFITKGIMRIIDIMDENGHLLEWEKAKQKYDFNMFSHLSWLGLIKSIPTVWKSNLSLLHRGPLTASCWLSHCFESTRESAGEERKEPLPNNVCESAFQRTNRAILSSINFFTIYLGRHFSLNGNVSCCSGNR